MIKKRIMIVEDEMIAAVALRTSLMIEGYDVVDTVSSGRRALESAIRFSPDLILMDIQLKGDMDGIEAAERIGTFQHIPIIYITGNNHLKTDKRLLETRPADVLSKPFSDDQLFGAISSALNFA